MARAAPYTGASSTLSAPPEMSTSVFSWYPAMAVSSGWGRKDSEEE